MSIYFHPQFLFISLLLICTTNFNHAYKQYCTHDQKTLLLNLKNELKYTSSNSYKLAFWNQTDNCCRWEGVECDDVGHVIGLQLDDEGIFGGIESESSLFSLRYLKKLNLAMNSFNGNSIPREIGNLTYLTHLDLSNADFGGQIPMEISLLMRLVSLDVSNYKYYDVHRLKLDLGMVLRNLTRLNELYLDSVDISANEIEWYNIISSSLPNLRDLSLRYCSLSSPPDPSPLKFQSLTLVRLDGNNLSTLVPNFFVHFSSLTTLYLSNCSLRGSLNLSNNFFFDSNFARPLSNFADLDLSHNSLSGNIPLPLFGLLSLEALDLSNNQFSGRVDEFPILGFSNIVILDLSNNRLEGTIPESFFQLESIYSLKLSYNLFNGTFRLEKIQRLRNLERFDLSYNNLSVDASSTNSSLSMYPELTDLSLASCNLYDFPDFIKQSSTLEHLDLSNNRIAGEIPSWIREIGMLVHLDLSNNRIAGEIPSSIWEVKTTGSIYWLNLSCNLLVGLQKPYIISYSPKVLDLHSNKLQGELPLPPRRASYVDFSNNNFDEPIPAIIGNSLSSLEFFSLKNNSISGSIPPSLCNNLSLQVLDLSANKLTGNIPPCLPENMESLQVLDLRRNNISGDIPDNFSVNCGLITLELSDNNLAGDVPLSLARCKALKVMNVGNNFINDTFPCMLSSSLRIPVLRSNRLFGEVGCHDSFPNLQIIDISSNNFSGNLHPKSFSSWRGMMAANDAKLRRSRLDFKVLTSTLTYQNEVTLTIKGLELKLVKIWPDFTSIDFSYNNFKGVIPEAIVGPPSLKILGPSLAIGDLTSLYLLNLSHNALTGAIPKSLGKLSELGSLDLSDNELTGAIPMELAKLTFLSVLNLSYNKLVGEIPNGPQIQTFSADSFAGNMGLCGNPTNISCENTKLGSVELEEKMKIEWKCVSVVLGYVVGLGSFVWVLFGCMSLREMYFHKVDEIHEKIFVGHKRRRRHGRRSVGRRSRLCC